MSNVILSTKNTSKQYKTTGIICSGIICVIGILLIIAYCFLSSKSSESALIAIMLLGLFLFFDGVITITVKAIFSSSYVDIYEDKIIGKGIQNFSVRDFDIKLNQVTSISIEGINIHIHTDSGEYKIISDKSTAGKVFSYYNNNIRK